MHDDRDEQNGGQKTLLSPQADLDRKSLIGLLVKDRYLIEKELGRGGFAVTYLASDTQLDSRPVVVKILREHRAEDPWVLKRFHQEMRALARLDHPGIVGALDSGDLPDGNPFLVMQFVKGVRLREVITPRGMDLERVATIGRQLGHALNVAHEAGICHRDVKPENIILQSLGEGEEQAKLIDFGIASVRDFRVASSGESTKISGSFAYMAPEQFEGRTLPASDVYALGVLAYEMVTGRTPFNAESPAQMVMLHIQGVKVKPKDLRPSLPEAAQDVIWKALAKHPEERYARARDFGEALAKALTFDAWRPSASFDPAAETVAAASETPPVAGTSGQQPLEIAHVLLMDLVGHSTLPMDVQKRNVQLLQRIVGQTPEFTHAEANRQLMRLPTGDGMALVFFGDAVAPVRCTLSIAAALKNHPDLKLRMGGHSGPVYRMADINANTNVAGGGVNIAQRVMECGDAGHILLSRTIAEVIGQHSQWAPHLQDLGEHSVKHDVRVHLYNLCTGELGNPAIPEKLRPAQGRAADAAKKAPPATAPQSAVLSGRISTVSAILYTLLVVAVVATLLWLSGRLRTPSRGPVITKVTSDHGLTADPALSPDGKFLAYASDRGGDGNLDIWLQQVAGGGEPIRLTRNAADDREPAFSSDGSTIVFHSARDGGGVYSVPTLGGDERLIARDGRRPRFSPDGRFIAYWVGEPDLNRAKVYVVPSGGGRPRQLLPEFAIARFPGWLPDGKHILFEGSDNKAAPFGDRFDLWVASVDGGAPVKTGAFGIFGRYEPLISPAEQFNRGTWAGRGDYFVFSASLGDSSNLWKIRISPNTWQATSPPERLTFGTAIEADPSVAADGTLAFSSLTSNVDVWSLPVSSEGKILGEMKRWGQTAIDEESPSVAADGKKVVFLSTRSGTRTVWIRDVESGRETPVAPPSPDVCCPVISPDGSKVAYRVAEGRKRAVYVTTVGQNGAERVCEDCGYPWDWSSDNKKILYAAGTAGGPVGLLDLESGGNSGLLHDPNYELHEPKFSPDGAWIVFEARLDPVRQKLFIAPLKGGKGAMEREEWIPITGGATLDLRACWSPNGNLLYFLSERDGFRCIWAQRLEPATKRPLGVAFPVQHFHSSRLSLANVKGIGEIGLSVGGGQLVFNLGELTGNVWMTKLESGQ